MRGQSPTSVRGSQPFRVGLTERKPKKREEADKNWGVRAREGVYIGVTPEHNDYAIDVGKGSFYTTLKWPFLKVSF